MNPTTACAGPAALQEYLLGLMPEPMAASVEAHLAVCPECQRLLPTLRAEDDFVVEIRARAGRAVEHDYTPTADAEHTPSPTAEDAKDMRSLLAPPQQPDEMGRLGDYRVLKVLGRGGMGVVYQAEDPKLKRLVALKVMLPSMADDVASRQRFLREGQAMAAVHHDHVVTIFQVDEDNGVPFLAMEFLHGMPLDQWLKAGRKPTIPQVLRIGREIAEGLAAAHARGLIHRDIKPGNIWLDSSHKGRVKILDFGLARSGREDVHLTCTGAILGTPAYMAPEQAGAAKVDARSDLFSLGCVLYRLCTGALPFAGDTVMAVLRALELHTPKPVRDLNADVPPALAELVTKLLAKDPVRRPQSAANVADALRWIEQEHATVTAQAPALARRRRMSALTACLTALLGLGLAAAIAVIVVKVRTPDGKETEVTAPPGSKFKVDAKGDVTVTLPGDAAAPAADELTNSIGMKLKLITPGTFTMGSPQDEEGRGDNEGPQHDVAITKAFYMGAYPVTKGQFAAFVKDDGYRTDAERPGETSKGYNAATQQWEIDAKYTWKNPGYSQTDAHPVVEVSWNDATAFCAWLSKKEGKTYELPREAEWEYACRAGTKTRFWCGDADASLQANANIADASLKAKWDAKDWTFGAWCDGYAFTSPVGSFNKNPWGLYDMGGNAWQWCADWYGTYKDEDIKDPKGETGGSFHVLRGGSWLDPPRECRSAVRHNDVAPAGRYHNLGFRVVLRPPAQQRPQQVGDAAKLPDDDAWLKQVAALPADKLVDAVVAELKARNPGFDGNVTPTIENGDVVGLQFSTYEVTNIAPVRALMRLRTLNLASNPGAGRLADLSPLKDLKLLSLDCQNTQVSDLSPLKGMPLTSLTLAHTQVSDLSPLKDMKLTFLCCYDTKVSDLTPLKDMKLTVLLADVTRVSNLTPLTNMKLTVLHFGTSAVSDLTPLKDMNLTELNCGTTAVFDLSPLKHMKVTDLNFSYTKVSDLTPLADMKLTHLDCSGTPVCDLSPLKDLKLTSLNCSHSKVSNLSPLKEMPLKELSCDFKSERDADILRSLKTLETINGKPAKDFWKEVDDKKQEN